MNKFFIIIILGLVIQGCSATWHINKALQKDPDIITTKTIIRNVRQKIAIDTVIHIPVKDFLFFADMPDILYDTVFIDKKIKLLPSFDTIVKDTSGTTVKIWMKKGRLFAEINTDKSIEYHLKDSINILNKIIENNTVIKTEKKPKFLTYLIWISAILILLFLIKIWKPK